MRTIIAGSRGVTDKKELLIALKQCGWVPSVVLSGTANGADRLGEAWAAENRIKAERYPADWNRFGKRAGYIRNEQMAMSANALIALWDGQSRGTKHMIDIANRYGLRTFVHLVPP